MPLLWAAYQGHLEVAQVLVDAGAALSATDKVRTLVNCADAVAGAAVPLRMRVAAARRRPACAIGAAVGATPRRSSVVVLTRRAPPHRRTAGRTRLAAPGGIPGPPGAGQAAAVQGSKRDGHHGGASLPIPCAAAHALRQRTAIARAPGCLGGVHSRAVCLAVTLRSNGGLQRVR